MEVLLLNNSWRSRTKWRLQSHSKIPKVILEKKAASCSSGKRALPNKLQRRGGNCPLIHIHSKVQKSLFFKGAVRRCCKSKSSKFDTSMSAGGGWFRRKKSLPCYIFLPRFDDGIFKGILDYASGLNDSQFWPLRCLPQKLFRKR